MIACIFFSAKPAPLIFTHRTCYMIATLNFLYIKFTLRTEFNFLFLFKIFKSFVEIFLTDPFMLILETFPTKIMFASLTFNIKFFIFFLSKIETLRTFFIIVVRHLNSVLYNLFKFQKNILRSFFFYK